MAAAPHHERVVVVDDIEYRLPFWVTPSQRPSPQWLSEHANKVTDLRTGDVRKHRYRGVA